MNWPLFVSTFSLIFIAELPDKTAFATLFMATRGRPGAIFAGVALAFFVQCAVAVAFGGLIAALPEKWVSFGAGLLFLAMAIKTWRGRDDESELDDGAGQAGSSRSDFLKSAWSAFMVIFVAEWGDITQLATATIAARERASLFTVFIASLAALWAVAAAAIVAGRKLGQVVPAKRIKVASAIGFAAVGAYFIYKSTEF